MDSRKTGSLRSFQRRTGRSRPRAGLPRLRPNRTEELDDRMTDVESTSGSRRGRQTIRADADLKPSAGGKGRLRLSSGEGNEYGNPD